jgi:hypothetical protein
VLPNAEFLDTGFWSTYFQIGFLPQMVIWIAFTILAGTLFGGIASAIIGRRKPTSQAATA